MKCVANDGGGRLVAEGLGMRLTISAGGLGMRLTISAGGLGMRLTVCCLFVTI